MLVVEDNQPMRLMLMEIMRAIGVRNLIEASDGGDALRKLKEGYPIDIIMADLEMGPMDGVEFVRQLRTAPDSPNSMCPVLMISGHSTERRVREARDAGVNEFLVKPITVRGILERIEEIIEHPRPYVRSPNFFGPDRRRRNDPAYGGERRRAGDKPGEGEGDGET